MAAPAVIALVAALGGGGAGFAAAPWLAAPAAVDQVATGVYADIGKMCFGTDPLIDGLSDLNPKSTLLSRIAADGDALCAAAQAPNTLPNRAALVVRAIVDMNAAIGAIGGGKTTPVIAPPVATRACGRAPCS